MLGLEKGIVRLVPHDEYWHRLFAEEASRIQAVIGEHLAAVEHVGSTSICGISAKPIIDMAAAVGGGDAGEKCVKPLESIGYEYRGEHGIKGRFYFIKGNPRTHHLHMVKFESEFWKSHIMFRDRLRRNPELAGEYDGLKRDLAEKFAHDRDAYLEGKAEFIKKVLTDSETFKE